MTENTREIVLDILLALERENLFSNKLIKDVLDKNGWSYRYSYNASRVYLEEVSKNSPSIKYFIDLHTCRHLRGTELYANSWFCRLPDFYYR